MEDMGYPGMMVEADVQALATAVADLQTELNRADRAIADELGFGAAEDLQVLRLLLAEGPLRVSDLARQRLASLSTASARLDRLEKRGLVVRERVANDRRAVVARLSEAGENAAAKSRAVRLKALGSIADGFPIEDLGRLARALNPDEETPPVAGTC